MINIEILKTADQIAQSFDAFLKLHPYLKCIEIFVAQILEQRKEGYEIIAIKEQEEMLECIDFVLSQLLAWGRNSVYR